MKRRASSVALLAILLTGPAAAQEPPKEKPKHENRLAKESSPYLLQHKHNPVDWYPWGPEAFAKAKQENKPVFLSIGYATCHWCHVMERESFENEQVAAYLNKLFVSIKVDREERPDVDEIYMSAVQGMTGRGGWPLTVFLDHDRRPFAGGTYFPQPARFGMPSFMEVLSTVRRLWDTKRDDLNENAKRLVEHVEKTTGKQGKATELTKSSLDNAFTQLSQSYDPETGGFGKAPKFPMPHNMTFLHRYYARTKNGTALLMSARSLDAIRMGGLRDHLAGGFHRYSVDREWQIPHFEKMLYDQAGLIRAFVEVYQLAGKQRYADVARETAEFVLTRMRAPGGGFTSAWDADSEGEEGKVYVWTPKELKALLGDDYELFAARYSVTDMGNWKEVPGKTHLQLRETLPQFAKRQGIVAEDAEKRLARCRKLLLEVRDERIQPLHDDKVLADWNGLLIGALAYAGRALGEPRYTQEAAKAAAFVLKTLGKGEGRLLHRWRAGQAGIPGMLEDYAFLVWGLTDLFEATQDPRWLADARALADRMLADLWDKEQGGFFRTSDPNMIARPKPTYDGAIPSGNAAAALGLVRLGHLTGERSYLDKATETLKWFSFLLAHHGGRAATLGLQALDAQLGPPREVVISGAADDPLTQAMLREANKRFRPNTVVIHRPLGAAEALVKQVPYVAEQVAKDGKPTAYVCENYACQAPVTSLEELQELLDPAKAQDGK